MFNIFVLVVAFECAFTEQDFDDLELTDDSSEDTDMYIESSSDNESDEAVEVESAAPSSQQS